MTAVQKFVAILTIALQSITLQAASAYAKQNEDQHHPVTICHRTNSVTNPYVQITVDDDAIDSAGGQSDHMNHPGPIFDTDNPPAPPHNDDEWGDIIPPVADDGFSLGHNGMNWTAEGQEILENDCQFPEPVTPHEEGDLKVTKVVDGGDATPSDFGFRLITPAHTDFVYPADGEDSVVFENLTPGTYSVEETGPDTYVQADSTCVNVHVVANEVATCTITNELIAGGDQGTVLLTIDKSANLDFVNPGSTVTYTVVVKNTGTKSATNAFLSDTLPPYFSYVAGTSKINGSSVADPTINGQTMTWPLGDLDPNENVVVEYQAKVANDAPAGQYTNNAVADSDETDEINDQVRLELRIPAVGGGVGGQPTQPAPAAQLPAAGPDALLAGLIPALVGFVTSLSYVLWSRKRELASQAE